MFVFWIKQKIRQYESKGLQNLSELDAFNFRMFLLLFA